MPARGNGLTAASYSPLRDIDPRLTAAVLEALREAGVAAYAVTASDQPVIGFEMVVRDRPVDRLYVDAAATETAKEIITAVMAEDEEGDDAEAGDTLIQPGATAIVTSDLDIAFEQIISGFDRTSERDAAEWPAQEDIATTAEDSSSPGGPATPSGTSASVSTGEARVPDGEDHFVPPAPQPLPELDPVSKLAWAGVIGGPLLAFVAVFIPDFPRSLSIFGLIAFAVGFGVLVARLNDHPDDTDPDDGAVV